MLIERTDIYVNGAWVDSAGSGRLAVYDSTNGAQLAAIPDGTAEDVDAAVRAARAAFSGWSASAPKERAELLRGVAAGLQARGDELADLFAREAGMPEWVAKSTGVLPVLNFTEAAELAETYPYEQTLGSSLIVREPIGVVGCITPWNYPLNMIASKVAYALAAGCTVVLKPSEIAPLDAYVIAEIIDSLDFPPGAFNMVMGTGPVVGEALVGHPDVDMISFTGSVRAGRRVSAVASETIKRVALELGGKSPNVLLDDLSDEDFDKAVRHGVLECYRNSGQTCSAFTRMLVPRRRLADAERIAADEIDTNFQPGSPFDEGVQLGPVASKAQAERIEHYIDVGIAEGARLITGGPGAPENLPDGYYVRPTVFSDVTSDMTIAREEIFGPVLSILPYDTEEQAVAIANDTPFGLHGSVWAATREHAVAVARRIRTGMVTINGGMHNPSAPWGGYKQSGNGREYGRYGFEEFLEVKAMHL